MGNIIGSAISNILGAFSLGLLFRDNDSFDQFDRSSRIYSLLLLVLTSFITPIIYFSHKATWQISGVVLIVVFAAYIVSIGWAISKGSLDAPEDSDSDSDSDSDDGGDSIVSARLSINQEDAASPETDPLLRPATNLPNQPEQRRRRSCLWYQISYLIFGFLDICLSGYVLSSAAIRITDAIGIPDVLFGVIILSIATTLPEKFIAVLSGHRGQIGILVANTAGSNVFLLSLCMGIIMVDNSGGFRSDNVNISELGVLWGSTLAFTLTVWFGAKYSRWIGSAMLAAYVAFIVLEFVVVYNVNDGR